MDQLRALEVLVAVVAEGSFKGAARKLALSPPSVTRHINELEAHLGTALLHRSTRSLRLTETGSAYLAEAEHVLEQLRAADDIARGAHFRPHGTLRLTAPILFGQYYIAPVIGEFLELYPEMRVEATFLDRSVNLIEEGFDIAIRIGHLPDSGLRATRLGAVRQVVCSAPAYFAKHGKPADPEELKDHRIIAFSGSNPAPDVWTFDGKRSVRLSPRMRFSTAAACIAQAAAGRGLARVLSYQIGPKASVATLETVLDEYSQEEWPIHLLHPEPQGQSAKLRAFRKLAIERLRDLSRPD